MELLPHQLARRDGPSVLVRSEPLRLLWTIEDLVTSDAHALRVRFSCSVRVADTAADRRMFGEVLLGSRAACTADDVVAHFAAPLRKAAANTTPAHTADEWLGAGSAEMQSALSAAAKSVAFACGLEALAPFNVEVESPSFQRQRMESMQRARAEERVAGQVQHFQRAAELLRQFQSLREQMPELTPSQLLEQVNPVDRGTTLHSLLMAGARSGPPQMLWAVAGPYLVRIDGHASPPKVELISLPTSAGPLRSVQPATMNGRHLLLVGARSGVMVVPPESPAETQVYTDPIVRTQLGFNRAVARGAGEIWASHGEAGVVGWKLGQTGEPFARFSANPEAESDAPPPLPSSVPPPLPMQNSIANSMASPSLIMAGPRGGSGSRPQGPRNLQVLDESHVVYSVGNEVVILACHGASDAEPRALPAESNAEVVAILPDERTLLVVHADSMVAVLSRDTRQVVERQRRAGRVSAVGALPWLGGVRMLLVDADGPIDCVGFEDPLITQYVSGHRALRVVTASPDLVAAISSDRQRVILWQSWDGRAPLAEVHITGIARHRVADVEFG